MARLLIVAGFVLSSLLVQSVNASVRVGVVVRDKAPKTSGAQGTLQTLKELDGIEPVQLDAIRPDQVEGLDVLVISHAYDLRDKEHLREFVRKGGGAILTHDAAGSGRSRGGFSGQTSFPELVQNATRTNGYLHANPNVRPIRRHPILEGIAEDGFKHTYWDHVALRPVDDRFVLMEDASVQDSFSDRRFRGTQIRWQTYYGGNAVLVAAPFEQGRVVLTGLLLGMGRDHQSRPIQGEERKLLSNAIAWAAGKLPIGVPADVRTDTGSKYDKWMEQVEPAFADGQLQLTTRLGASEAGAEGGDVSFELTLPQTVVLGKWQPIVIDAEALPASRYTVTLLNEDGVPTTQVLGQVELNAQGKRQLVFIANPTHSTMRVHLTSDQGELMTPIVVLMDAQGKTAEVHGPHYRLIFAVEEEKPTIQAIQAHDWDWHPTWDGLERQTLSAPLMRLAPTLWPFRALPLKVEHERGRALSEPRDPTMTTFPVRCVLSVGEGRVTVYRTGQISLEGFEQDGRLATIGFDGYQRNGQWQEEAASYDFTPLRADWLWAVKHGRYALGGEFAIGERMGETGLAPGLEREVGFYGRNLVIRNHTDELASYQGAAVPQLAAAKVIDRKVVRSESLVSARQLPIQTVRVRKLIRIRGDHTQGWQPLPEPVEIYKDMVAAPLPDVQRWELRDVKNEWQIGPSIGAAFANAIVDSELGQATIELDPGNEDADVWRRIFLKYQGDQYPIQTTAKLVGLDAEGGAVVVQPLQLEAWVSVPVGVFTYSAQWVAREEQTPADNWPKLIRDIALANMDYVIHSTFDSSFGADREPPQRIAERMQRYGLWWLASLQYQSLRALDIKNDYAVDVSGLSDTYAEAINRYADYPNVIGWYLSDEVAHGKPGDAHFESSYAAAAAFYDVFKNKLPNELAINLITTSHTPHEVAAEYLKTDLFSWDPYGVGAKWAFENADKINQLYRLSRQQPAWITLRSCGPTFYDTLDLWLDIRQRSLAAMRGGVDGINFFMYAHWFDDLEQNSYYAVLPGPEGPITTPRWQALSQLTRDLELLTTVEYVMDRTGAEHRDVLDQAMQLGQQGKWQQMRTSLRAWLKQHAAEKD